MNTKAQLSYFLIIGLVVIVLIAVAGTIFQQRMKLTPEQSPLSHNEVREYVESCIAEVGEAGMLFIGLQGGYFTLPNTPQNILSNTLFGTAEYFNRGQNTMPSLPEIEKQLGAYVTAELQFCLKNFQAFQEQGINIFAEQAITRENPGDNSGVNTGMRTGMNAEINAEMNPIVNTVVNTVVNTKVTIAPAEVQFHVFFPITIIEETSSERIEEFSTAVSSIQLHKVYSVARELVEDQLQHGDICLNCLSSMAEAHHVRFRLQQLTNQSVLFTIIDLDSIVDHSPYRFRFVNTYERHPLEDLEDWQISGNRQILEDGLLLEGE